MNNFLLDEPAYWQSDRGINHVTSSEKLTDCKSACDDYEFCKKVNGNEGCWKERTRCEYCTFKSHQLVQTTDLPYYHQYPEYPDFAHKSHALFVTPRVCGQNTYSDYIAQYDKYTDCIDCNKRGMCWNPAFKKCVKCKQPIDCGKEYGCLSSGPGVAKAEYDAPIDPLFTGCQKCWKTK